MAGKIFNISYARSTEAYRLGQCKSRNVYQWNFFLLRVETGFNQSGSRPSRKLWLVLHCLAKSAAYLSAGGFRHGERQYPLTITNRKYALLQLVLCDTTSGIVNCALLSELFSDPLVISFDVLNVLSNRLFLWPADMNQFAPVEYVDPLAEDELLPLQKLKQYCQHEDPGERLFLRLMLSTGVGRGHPRLCLSIRL